MSLLSKKVIGTLPEGKYNVKFISADEIEERYSADGKVAVNARVILHLINDKGTPINISCFEKQLDYITRDLINAYHPGEEYMSFVEAMEGTPEWLPVTKYITTSKTGDKFVNYSFNPKFEIRATAANAAEDADLAFN